MTASKQDGAGREHDAIRFILDGEIKTVRDIDPNKTLLNYLREDLRKTGTKEGCAEGDCGACTVVLGELVGDRVQFRAVNSCIKFLPTVDGKELFTVESLRVPNGRLHPVQQAMVECHSSQCGFCTPGFVMSLFALYNSEETPSRQRVNDVLAGNLCRCTGYRPIIDAAQKMYDRGSEESGDREWLHRPFIPAEQTVATDAERAMVDRLRAIERRETLAVSGPGLNGKEHRYFAPNTVADLADLVKQYPHGYILAGGTDIGLWVTKQRRDLETIIYIGNVLELKTLEVSSSHIEVGAAVTITDAHSVFDEHFPDMGELYRRFASPPIRNAATIGGNIANGSPIGDSMPGLIVLGTSIVLRCGEARREVALEDFYLAYQLKDMAPGEFVERVRVPIEPADRRFATYKISKRFDQDISAVCAAFCLEIREGRVHNARVCFGGMAAISQRALRCEAALNGQPWNESTVIEASKALDQDFTPIGDMRASAHYRGLVAGNLLMKFYLEHSGYEGATRVIGTTENRRSR
jgi:xanthine dehydrogenase small subunit